MAEREQRRISHPTHFFITPGGKICIWGEGCISQTGNTVFHKLVKCLLNLSRTEHQSSDLKVTIKILADVFEVLKQVEKMEKKKATMVRRSFLSQWIDALTLNEDDERVLKGVKALKRQKPGPGEEEFPSFAF